MKIHRTLVLLMLSDVCIVTGFGLFEPFLAVFVKENIVGGTLFSAGLASTFFLVTKSLIQLPFARYVDKHDDKVKWLLLGTLIICLVPIIFLFATHIYIVFVAQILYGVGSALAFPTWLGLWSRHLDTHNETFEWSMYSTLVSLGTAFSAAVGSGMAELFGFTTTIIFMEFMVLIGFSFLFFLQWHAKIETSIGLVRYHRLRASNRKKH